MKRAVEYQLGEGGRISISLSYRHSNGELRKPPDKTKGKLERGL
jgi:hypothetical protein